MHSKVVTSSPRTSLHTFLLVNIFKTVVFKLVLSLTLTLFSQNMQGADMDVLYDPVHAIPFFFIFF